jgi:hypothetical protein
MLLSIDCTACYLATGQQSAIKEDSGFGNFFRPGLHCLPTLEKGPQSCSTVEVD